MTDWIDDLAGKLEGDERQKHDQYRHDVLRDELMSQLGPDFLDKLANTLQVLADELDEKVGGIFGGIRYSRRDTHVSVFSAKGQNKLTVDANIKARKITTETQRSQSPFPEARKRQRDFSLSVSTGEHPKITAYCENVGYSEPAEIAALLLKEAFGRG